MTRRTLILMAVGGLTAGLVLAGCGSSANCVSMGAVALQSYDVPLKGGSGGGGGHPAPAPHPAPPSVQHNTINHTTINHNTTVVHSGGGYSSGGGVGSFLPSFLGSYLGAHYGSDRC